MFDNPKKELKRLEDQLLAAEEEAWEIQEQPTDAEELYPEEEPAAQEPEEEDAPPSKATNRIPMLVAALLLEIAALFGVLTWWLLWR